MCKKLTAFVIFNALIIHIILLAQIHSKIASIKCKKFPKFSLQLKLHVCIRFISKSIKICICHEYICPKSYDNKVLGRKHGHYSSILCVM